MHSTPHLIKMANQIAANFGAFPPEVAAQKLADHLTAFWEPRMKTALLDYADADGAELGAVAKAAAGLLRHKSG